MGHKIFISYKFHDVSVYQNIKHNLFEAERPVGQRTPRDYVNVLQEYIEDFSDHIYKGEDDGEPLDDKSDDWIWNYLKELMFDSTITIVLISPKMKTSDPENKQWIPWEISYSLGNETRKSSTGKAIRSNTNAMLAIVLPDLNNSYAYYFENKTCCPTKCRLNKTNTLFSILRKNTFNRINDDKSRTCEKGDKVYTGNLHSFIPFYKWSDIASKEALEKAIEQAFLILSQKEKYNICYDV